jgi:hypothetical protein
MSRVHPTIPVAKFRTASSGRTRWPLIAVVLGLGAVLAWRFAPSWRGGAKVATAPAAVVNAPTTLHGATTASPSSPSALPLPAKAPRTGKLAVLRTASREEVLAYARDLLEGGGPLENIVALLEFLVNDRPALAVDLAREIGRTDGERQVLLYATLSAWADKDASGALSWAFQNSSAYDIPGHASLLYIVLEQIAADDPASAVAATTAALRDGGDTANAKADQDVARFTLEALLKHGHPNLAQDALERWSRGPEKARLNPSDFQIVAMSLAGTSYANAGAWLESLPSSSARNEVYRSFATAWARENAPEAMDWAQNLNPADGGDDVRVATFRQWLASDRAAATQWLQTHNSPDPTRLQAQLNPPDE